MTLPIGYAEPKFSSPDNATIDVMAVIKPGMPPIPYTVARDDPEMTALFHAIVAGQAVAPYEPADAMAQTISTK